MLANAGILDVLLLRRDGEWSSTWLYKDPEHQKARTWLNRMWRDLKQYSLAFVIKLAPKQHVSCDICQNISYTKVGGYSDGPGQSDLLIFRQFVLWL